MKKKPWKKEFTYLKHEIGFRVGGKKKELKRDKTSKPWR